MLKKQYKAIIFDVGDTLVEHYPSQRQIYRERIASLGFTVDEKTEAAIAAAVEQATYKQITLEHNGAPRMSEQDFNEMLDEAALLCVTADKDRSMLFEKLRYIPLSKQELRVMPDALETLTKLKDLGFRMAIVSNHRAWLPEYLNQIGLADFFESIVVSDLVGVEKPDAQIMRIALNELGLNGESCLYVGDHPFDVLCAKSVGVDCAWLAPADSVLPESIPFQEDVRLSNLLDLLCFVGGKGSLYL